MAGETGAGRKHGRGDEGRVRHCVRHGYVSKDGGVAGGQ